MFNVFPGLVHLHLFFMDREPLEVDTEPLEVELMPEDRVQQEERAASRQPLVPPQDKLQHKEGVPLPVPWDKVPRGMVPEPRHNNKR